MKLEIKDFYYCEFSNNQISSTYLGQEHPAIVGPLAKDPINLYLSGISTSQGTYNIVL